MIMTPARRRRILDEDVTDEIEEDVSGEFYPVTGPSKKARTDDPDLLLLEKLIEPPTVVPDARDTEMPADMLGLCDASRLEEGSILYRCARLVVMRRDGPEHLLVRDMDQPASVVRVEHKMLEAQCYAPDHYKGEPKKITKKQLKTLLQTNVGENVVKIVYTSTPSADAVTSAIIQGARIIDTKVTAPTRKVARMKQLLVEAHRGSVEVLRGFLVSENEAKGVYCFVDADELAKGKHPKEAQRQIPVNNIMSLTLKNAKFVVKQA